MALESVPAPESNIDHSAATNVSQKFFSDPVLTTAYADVPPAQRGSDGNQLLMDNPYNNYGDGGDAAAARMPLLNDTIKGHLGNADALQFSSPLDNQAAGEQPDFRLVPGTDGQLRLEPVGEGDPLSDGKLNIEMDTQNRSLQDAIMNADQNMKEYIREMMAYWSQNHPGKPYPAWWQAILDGKPNVPDGSKPVPVEPTPPGARPRPSQVPQPPAAPKQGWQPDYRSGGGTGYGGGSGGGGGGRRGGGRDSGHSYYGGRDSSGRNYNVPSEVPDFKDPTNFVDRLAKTIMKNEGALNADGTPKFTAFNPDDNGGISVGLRQWHAGGALPELLNAWKDANPQKYEQYFRGNTPAQINAMSAGQFNSQPDLVQGMKSALADPEYQQVQTRLLNDWVRREVKTGMDQGLTSERELATFVDIANQYGQSRANGVAGMGRAQGDQGAQMNAAVRGGQYAERFANISANFSTDRANLETRIPQPTEFGQRLAQAALNWDARMSGTGWCARAVQRALADVGLRQFVGSGDAWNMLGPLKRSGLFVEVPMNQAAVGDLIVRPGVPGGSIQGDISVITARNGNRIQQTNDATYDFVANNPRYGGQAVFLRYVGDRAQTANGQADSQQPRASQPESQPRATQPESERRSDAGANQRRAENDQSSEESQPKRRRQSA